MRTNIFLLSLLVSFAFAENADIEEILNENESNFSLSEKSQDKVNDLSTEKDSLLAEWKVVVKQVEGLKIYNEQKRRQIAAQEERLATISAQTKEIDVITRDIPVLMEEMVEVLDNFVMLDAPFSLDERVNRINQITAILTDPTVTKSEQVRQVMEAYSIEGEYGRTIETYEDAIEIDGEEKVVNILRIGRIALMYQLKDQSQAGVWDTEANGGKGGWVEVDGYRLAIRDGIRMANKTAPLDLLAVPVKFKAKKGDK